MAAHRVAIEAGDAGLREHAVQQLFQFLRARAQEINVLAAAVHAGFRHGRGVSAIVADHFVLALVMGERDGAVLAFELLAASAAEHDGRISAAVEQHHDLLFALEPLFDFGGEFARDDLLVAGLLELLAHVDDFDFGQRTLLHAIGQFDQRIFIFLRVEIRLQRRRGRAQHDDGIRHLGAHHGNIAGVIARRFFLLVGGVVLFVDDDEREIGDRRKDRRARAHDHARFAALDAVPLLGALAVGQRGVQDGDFVAEDLMQVGGDGGRQADLGNQQDGGASGFEHGAHARQIDRGLSRAGDAVQQHAGEFASRDAFAHPLERGLLRGVEIEVEERRPRLGARDGEVGRLFDDLDQAAPDQRASVVRGTSSDCSVSTGTLPPEAASVSTSCRWLSFSLPSADFSSAILTVRVASCARGDIFADQPFLADHSGQNGFRNASGGAKVSSRS